MEGKHEGNLLVSKICASYIDLILTDFNSLGFYTLPRNLALSDVIALFCKFHKHESLKAHVGKLASDSKLTQTKVAIASAFISTGKIYFLDIFFILLLDLGNITKCKSTYHIPLESLYFPCLSQR